MPFQIAAEVQVPVSAVRVVDTVGEGSSAVDEVLGRGAAEVVGVAVIPAYTGVGLELVAFLVAHGGPDVLSNVMTLVGGVVASAHDVVAHFAVET